MNREARTITLVAVLVALTLVGAFLRMGSASQSNIIGQDGPVTLAAGVALNPSASTTTSAFTYLAKSSYQSVFYQVSGQGGNPSITIDCLGSQDGTTFAWLDSGGNVTSSAADGSARLKALSIPMCQAIKFRLLNNSATVTANVTVAVMSQ